jgi:hypothetical protein
MVGATCIATAREKRRPLPVDALVPEPLFASTHAITIAAPPERVWPWIAQMGAGRAGWYSWDAIDNGGTSSATSILPAFQPIVRGRASSHWLDLARAKPPAGRGRIFIERAYAGLATLPRPLLIAFARLGHRIMEARHLRGIQRRCATASGHDVRHEPWRKALVLCGIASSVLYALMIWAIRYEGYSVVSQVPSELTAIGAPTRALWAQLGWIYTVLETAFGFGVWQSAGRSRAVRIVGGLILAHASLGLLWPLASMHQREVLAAGGGTFGDTLHVALAVVTVFLMFLAIGFGATAFGTRFRSYSIATIVTLLTFGALTFIEAPRLQANLPTPWIGLWERINISVFLLWVAVLATLLWRTRTAQRETEHVSPISVQDSRG